MSISVSPLVPAPPCDGERAARIITAHMLQKLDTVPDRARKNVARVPMPGNPWTPPTAGGRVRSLSRDGAAL